MSDEDHEAMGAMLHRGKVEAATRGRDYHNELAAENERLRERVEFLERRLTSEENVAEKCGAAADTLRAKLAAANTLLRTQEQVLRNLTTARPALAAAKERADFELFESAIVSAIGGNDYLDPPDGGDVPLPEQVQRMRAERDAMRELLREWDALINYQYSGSREAMSALTEISQKTARALYGDPPWPIRTDALLKGDGK